MSLVTLPYVTGFSGGEKAFGSQVLDDLKAIRDVVNGQLDDANMAAAGLTLNTVGKSGSVGSSLIGSAAINETHINFDQSAGGVIIPRLGPTAKSAAQRIAIVSKSVTITSSAGIQGVGVTFASDCIGGNPGFTGTPVLLGSPVLVGVVSSSSEYPDKIWVTSLTSTGCTANLYFSVAPIGNTMTLQFGVIGDVAA